MLRELADLSKTLGLNPIGYEYCTITWDIVLSDGAAIAEKLQTSTNGKTKDGRSLLVPQISRNGADPVLLDDASEYVFGLGDRGEKRHPMYISLLEKCYQNTGNFYLEEILDYLKSGKLPDGLTSDNSRDRVIISIDGQQVSLQPDLKEWWKNYYLDHQQCERGTCLLTGKETSLCLKMPAKVKGVEGANSSGAAISSFDKPFSQSYGWSGSQNAPIGLESAIEFHQALDTLLRSDHNHTTVGDRTFVYWGDVEGEGIDSGFWSSKREDSLNIKALFNTPSSCNPPRENRSSNFYIASLMGNSGRVSVASFDSVLADDLRQNLKSFLESQIISDLDKGLSTPRSVYALRFCALHDSEKFTGRFDSALIDRALFGKKLPDYFAFRVLDRIYQDEITAPRLQALALYLGNTMPIQLKDKPDSKQIAYILGKIAFLMHKAQKDAQGSDSTNVLRSLRTLATTPNLVFSRLYYGCEAHHLPQLQGFIAKRLYEAFNEFGEEFNPATDLPQTFGLTEQSCFFMGWAKTKAEIYTKKETASDLTDIAIVTQA